MSLENDKTKKIEPKLFEWVSCPKIEGYFWMWDNDCKYLPQKPLIYYIYRDDDFADNNVGWSAATICGIGQFRINLDNAPPFHFYGPLVYPPSSALATDAPWEVNV